MFTGIILLLIGFALFCSGRREVRRGFATHGPLGDEMIDTGVPFCVVGVFVFAGGMLLLWTQGY